MDRRNTSTFLFNVNSLAPAPQTPMSGPQKESLCLVFWGKNKARRVPTSTFFWGILGSRRVLTWAILRQAHVALPCASARRIASPFNLCHSPLSNPTCVLSHIWGVPTIAAPMQKTVLAPFLRRRTNVQQLTCKMVWSFSFYSLLFSFRFFELKQ